MKHSHVITKSSKPIHYRTGHPSRNHSCTTILFILLLFLRTELSGQLSTNAVDPSGAGPLNLAAQEHGGVSTLTVPQVQPISPYLIRPEQVIEHATPNQPTQPDSIPAIMPEAVQDSSAVLNNGPNIEVMPNTPGLLRSFQGISATGWIPPDPIIAAGPSHLVVATNSSFAIYTKGGSRQYSTTFFQWYSNLNPPSAIFDPKIVYDAHAGRWIIFVLAVNDSTQQSYYLISVSDDADPNGQWWNWKLDAGLNAGAPSGFWADFPGLGYDSGQAVYITSNQYTFPRTSAVFQYAKVRILYKSQLYWAGSGGSLSWWDFWNLRDADGTASATVKPAQAGSALAGEYLANTRSNGGSAVTMWRLTNPLASPPTLVRQATVSIGSYSLPPNAVQLNGSDLIDVGDCRTQELWYQQGRLVTAFTEAYNWGSGNVSALRTLVIESVSNTVELNSTFGANNLWYFYPAMIRDSAGNLALAFNRSGGSEYANCRYTVKLLPDAAWEGSESLHVGEGYYAQYGSPPGPRNRWGDYSGATLDSADPSKVWICSEYATTGNQWSTWIGQFPLGSTGTPKPDFNGDGKADILWQNNSTGQHTIWLMNGTTYMSSADLISTSLAWQIASTGDFNNDGKVDIYWQNTQTGQIAIQLMNGTTTTGWVDFTFPTAWKIVGTGDFNGDSKTDILWQNTQNGQVTIWLLNGTATVGWVDLFFNVALSWTIVGTGDFNSDGKVDILWLNTQTGQVSIQLMNGTGTTGWANPITVSPAWRIAGASDFNGDGKADILWQNMQTAQRTIQLMNGTVTMGWADLFQGQPEWEMRNH